MSTEPEPQTETKLVDLDVYEVSGPIHWPGTFQFYLVAFDRFDLAGEATAPWAFRGLGGFVQGGSLALDRGGAAVAVATIDGAKMDQFGLRVWGRFHASPIAQAARKAMLDQADGGDPVRARLKYLVADEGRATVDDGAKTVRLLKNVRLLEVALVEGGWSNLDAETQSTSSPMSHAPNLNHEPPETHD